LGRRETAPGGLDLGIGGTMTSRPCLGGGRRVLGNVKPDDGAGGAMNSTGLLTSYGLWN